MMQTDVSAKSLAASGAVSSTRTRVRGMSIEPGTLAGSVVFKNNSTDGTGGTTVMTFNTPASGQPYSITIPAEGVLFETNVYATLTNAKVTVFYG